MFDELDFRNDRLGLRGALIIAAVSACAYGAVALFGVAGAVGVAALTVGWLARHLSKH